MVRRRGDREGRKERKKKIPLVVSEGFGQEDT